MNKNNRKTSSETGFKSTIIASVMIMFILFSMGLASAWEFDNVKSYDTQTKTATITNAFGLGEKIADVQLKSDTSLQVGLGYQKVFEYEVTSYTDYSQFIKETEVYNIKNGNTKESKQIDLKYLTYEYIEIEDYKEVCSLNKTGDNETCIQELIGKHTESREVWKDLDDTSMKIETKKISGWTNVQQGDYYEWIPNFAGVQVQEWATWSGNLSTGLLSYWKFDDNDLRDWVAGANNGTNAGTTNATGKIQYGRSYSGATGETISVGSNTIDVTDGNFTIGLWLKWNSNSPAGQSLFNSANANGWAMDIDTTARTIGFGKNAVNRIATSTIIPYGVWIYSNVVYDTSANVITFYLNGTQDQSPIAYSSTFDAGLTYYIGGHTGYRFNGTIDEVAFFTRALSPAEIQILYNSYKGCQYGNESCFTPPDASPIVTLNSPADASTSNSYSNTFSCTGTDDSLLQNMSLYINGTLNQTNTSVFNNTPTTFTTSLAEGYYNWTCKVWDNATIPQSATATARNFTINTTPFIAFITPPTLVDNANITQEYIPMKVNISTPYYKNVTYSLRDFNGTNYTQFYTNTTYDINFTDMPDAHYHYDVTVCTTTDKCNITETRHINHDVTPPAINITSPLATLDYQAINTNLTVNWTVTDEHLDKCWYAYKGTNTTVTCSANTTNINITDWFNKNLTFWANDTYGNYNSTFFSWNYRLLFISETYSSSVLEGSSTQFSTLLITNGTDITITNLSYNGGSYLGSISQSGNNFTISRSLSVPTVTADTNKSFFWKITQADGFVYNYTAKNQTVVNFGIDNCSVNGNVLYNFTIVDEKTQTEINETGSNSLAQINLQMYAYGTTTSVLSFNSQYNQTNPFAVCINNSIGNETYSLDAQVKYQADGYEQEFYHIQNSTISNSSFTTNITLYDLNTTNSQVFKLIYKDASYLPVYNALIVVGRKYIDEGVFKNVEIPKTDVQGETVAHLVLNDVVYNFTIIQNGVILGTFDNLFAVCQTPLVSECIIEFNSFAGEVGVPDFDAEKDFSYSLGYLNTTRTIQSNFSIPSGNPSTVTLTVKKSDALGTAICTDTLTSASGTLSCVVPASIGNSTVYASLYKNGGFVGWGNLKLNQRPQDIYGDSVMVFISVISMMVLIGIAISGNGVITVILLALGLIVLFALNIVANNGFLGKTATILWILIALVLILIRKGRR